MNLEKPDFLPFTSLPIPKQQSLVAGEYIFSLEVSQGPLSADFVYEILTGAPIGSDRSLENIRIARQVFQVIGRQAPHTIYYNPIKVLQSLERA